MDGYRKGKSRCGIPRPPRAEATISLIRVVVNGQTLADTRRAQRVQETSHSPVYYLPPDDVLLAYLRSNHHSSMREFKGAARYYDLVLEDRLVHNIASYYPEPQQAYAAIANHLAFFSNKVDAAFVDDEQIQAQAGDFYGGWIARNIVGPFKGEPRTRGW